MSTPSLAIPEHEIVLISKDDDESLRLRQQCHNLRIDVFHHEQKFPLETEIDDMEDLSTHFLLRLLPSLTPVGTIRGYSKPPGSPSPSSSSSSAPHYKLSRLAVLKPYRHYKFGRELVEAFHEWVKHDAINSQIGSDAVDHHEHRDWVEVICHSQIPVKGFYAKFGYTPEGDEFDEDGDPHQKMVVRLPLTR